LLIDNYAEVQESSDETRFPHLAAVLERKINEFFAEMYGVVKKFEKDKFLFVIKADKLDYFKENCLKLSENFSRIELTNIKATVSMGVGVNCSNLAGNMEFARGALDLALGRGGNQVIIKYSNDNYCFLGGDSDEVITNSKVGARVKAMSFLELLMSASDVIIMGHKNPDLDSLGSAAGLYAISNFYGRKCKIVLNEVTDSIKTLYTRFMSEAKYADVFINSETAKKMLKRKTLLIIVDTHRAILCECPELIAKAKRVVLFDHHRKSADAIERLSFSFHVPYASSTCELVTSMLTYFKGLKLIKPETEGLLAGITVDTKNFAFKTTSVTFDAAAYLKKCGADTVSVRKLFKGSFDSYKAKANVVCNAQPLGKNMAISFLREEVDNPTVLIAQAADEMLGIKGIDVAFVICESDGRACISARSLKFNVQKLMEKMGGGGHFNGAAAQLADTTIDEAAEILKQKINEYI
jgi:c-di-AMP phosphodiesterase-like protein